MKLRNQLLALACLAGFVALGYFYITAWVVQKPVGIILFVSDGLVARHLTMARLYEGGAEHKLGMEAFPHLALLRNPANDFAVPDDAAVATALSTGVRVNHRHLCSDGKGGRLTTIAELARKHGRSFGVVTNGLITDPVPAAGYARTDDVREPEPVAAQLVSGRRPEVVFGGGALDFLPGNGKGRRKDNRDLLAELRGQGCALVRTKAELENAGAYAEKGVVGVFSDDAMAYSREIESGSPQPSLSDMVRSAIGFLQQNPKGYVLVVEAALVGEAASQNEGERVLMETLALDRAITTATKYAGDKALILAVGKHAVGGLSLNGFPLREDHGVALLGSSPEGYPYLTWATGPHGPTGTDPRREPAAHFYPNALNTAEDVLALGQGLGAERLHGIMDNTAIFRILRDAL